jgi:hypothetical protein
MRFTRLRNTPTGTAVELAFRRTRFPLPSHLPHYAAPRVLASVEYVQSCLASITDSSPADQTSNWQKGRPELGRVKRELAAEAARSLQRRDLPEALRTLAQLAAGDVSDPLGFFAHQAVFGLVNEGALDLARKHLRANVVLHISCEDRLARAMESTHSFAAVDKNNVAQAIVVGSPSAAEFRFDPENLILRVPTHDSYEQLPAKVMSAVTFLHATGTVQSLLKVDDDHRLNDYVELLRGFERVAHRLPVQMGRLSKVFALGENPRAWHFGKTADPVLSKTFYTLPGTTRWANGADGYFLNREALRLLAWSDLYFPQYISQGLYEDLVVSDLLERQGGRLLNADMSRFISAVTAY